MSKHLRSLALLAIAASCVAPSTSSTTAAVGEVRAEDRDVAAALGTWTVRAYQPVVISVDPATLSSLPRLADASAPVRVVSADAGEYVTVIGPYRDRDGRAAITRVSMQRQGELWVASYFTRALGSTDSSRGDFTPLAPVRISAN